MQFRDLGRQYVALRPSLDVAVIQVMESGEFIGGAPVATLEEKLADFVGVKHCISCGNGTDALQLALMAWGVGPGDAVIVPDFTFFSSGEVVSAVGATPIFVDVDPETFNIDCTQLEAACYLAEAHGLRPRAVIPVDLFGLPADYPRLTALCDQLGLLVLEDGAQGFGGSIGERRACSFGDIATTSFFPAKPLGCYGDGGAVFTDDDGWAELIGSYAVHGKGAMKYDNVRVGMNSRLDSIQASILNIKLSAFEDHEIDMVNEVAYRYTELLDAYAKQADIRLPMVPQGFVSAWAQYTIILPNDMARDAIQRKMRDAGIPTMVYYPKPMHEQRAFKNISLTLGSCEVTRSICQSVLSLPMGPYLSKSEQEQVVQALTQL